MDQGCLELTPFNSGFLQVADLHKLYFHEYGNPEGTPILQIHGGPGSESKPKYAKLYDLEKFRLIFYDQRGCGKSTPQGELRENTTQDLVEDIEKLRIHLNIDRWYMYGPSWGSTLTLLYAQKYPERVEKIVLRGVFFGSKTEVDWIYKFGANQIFPENWDKLMTVIPVVTQGDYIDYLYEIATGDDIELKRKLLPEFSHWEGSLLTLSPAVEEEGDVDREVVSTSIMLHYIKHNFFLEQDGVLLPENIAKISSIPMLILNGRYDLITPMISAYRLHKALPNSKLEAVHYAGHHGSDPDMAKVLEEYLRFEWL